MSNSGDNHLEFEEMVYLYHKGTKIYLDDLESLSLKKLKSMAKSVNLFVNFSSSRYGEKDKEKAKQRIISALKIHIKNNFNPHLRYEDDEDAGQKNKIRKVTMLEFPCQKQSVKNFSMEFEITFPEK
eukprot:14300.XXX_1037521_1037901_1 [CDS] Oithona nana genome sequencing.